MPRLRYVDKRFRRASLDVIAQADAILTQYAAQGFTMTLRQVYYQFVSRGLIPNRQSEYKRLGEILNDARLAGLLDWSHMEDRTRNLNAYPFWDSPADIIASAAASFRRDRWKEQETYVEVWIEKDALTGVIDVPCGDLYVPYFSCRGYTSQSELWQAARRLIRQTSGANAGRRAVVLHFGDHDPSGIDMTRDIEDRLAMFCRAHGAPAPTVNRLALNYDQVEQYNPPPNPTKLTDSRAEGYIAAHGLESWELDALDPTVIDALVRMNVSPLIDNDKWSEVEEREARERDLLDIAAREWDSVADYIDRIHG
jgi:hypothetical protein